ncbi:MAG: CorA family divalent cation transporter [Minisyncoccia bacterium]
MIFRHKYRGGVWVDLEHPTEEDVRSVTKEFSIGERLEAELFSPTLEPLVASDAGVIFLVIHFPANGTTDGEMRDQEIDLLVGEGFIITVRYEVVAPLHRLQKLLAAHQLISPHDGITTDALLEILFAHLYTSVRDHIHTIADRLTSVERDMFNGLEHTTVRAISNISREFLHIEASLANQGGPLEHFMKALSSKDFLEKSFDDRSVRILAERTQAVRLATTYRAVATELRETNASLLEARQNEIMKTLTVVTFIFLPLELITFVFGMHALGTPLEQNPNAFWIIAALMFIVGIGMTLYLNLRRWL